MIERKYRVTITKEISLQVGEEHLSDEYIADFNSCIMEVGEGDEAREEILSHAAGLIACYDDNWIEGLGPASSNKYNNPVVLYKEDVREFDIEVERID